MKAGKVTSDHGLSRTCKGTGEAADGLAGSKVSWLIECSFSFVAE